MHSLTNNVKHNHLNTITKMNTTVNGHYFVSDMVEKGWNFEQMYIDHYVMHQTNYVQQYTDGFFNRIVLMQNSLFYSAI